MSKSLKYSPAYFAKGYPLVEEVGLVDECTSIDDWNMKNLFPFQRYGWGVGDELVAQCSTT
jgi:hypothetical protein